MREWFLESPADTQHERSSPWAIGGAECGKEADLRPTASFAICRSRVTHGDCRGCLRRDRENVSRIPALLRPAARQEIRERRRQPCADRRTRLPAALIFVTPLQT